MRPIVPPFRLCLALLLPGACAPIFSGCSTPSRHAHAGVPVEVPPPFLVRTNYKGWEDSFLLSNGRVEAIVVPRIGRVMQFRFAGSEEGPFWENRELLGKPADPQAAEWMNFGGDKAWPSPQEDWDDQTLKAWPPPAGFDASPVEAKIDDRDVILIGPVDPNYGIRATRRISLDLERPVMRITTTFEKVSGAPLRTGVWVITQLKNPVAVYMPVSRFTRYRDGYNLQSQEPPPSLRREPEWISLTRDPKTSYKIGSDAGTLVWMGDRQVLRIDSPRVLTGAHYPDQESSAEIYTNPDPLTYIELEMLGPLHKMKVGEKITRSSTYTLLPRREAEIDLEMERLMAL